MEDLQDLLVEFEERMGEVCDSCHSIAEVCKKKGHGPLGDEWGQAADEMWDTSSGAVRKAWDLIEDNTEEDDHNGDGAG